MERDAAAPCDVILEEEEVLNARAVTVSLIHNNRTQPRTIRSFLLIISH